MGKTMRKEALRAFEKSEGVKTQKCGLFICGKRPYLGASPDAVINDNEIVEVKCPFVGRKDQILPGQKVSFPWERWTGSNCFEKKKKNITRIMILFRGNCTLVAVHAATLCCTPSVTSLYRKFSLTKNIVIMYWCQSRTCFIWNILDHMLHRACNRNLEIYFWSCLSYLSYNGL